MIDLQKQIDEGYKSASQIETMARQLEARIGQIDGAKKHLPARRYGQPVDLEKIKSNLTLTSLIAKDDAGLAHYCGIDPGIKRRMDEQREAQAMRAESLRMQTEALRQQNAQAQFNRERAAHAGINQVTGRRHGY